MPVRLKSPAGIMNMHRITVAIAAQKPSHATHSILTNDFITQLSLYRGLSRKFVKIKINCFCFYCFAKDCMLLIILFLTGNARKNTKKSEKRMVNSE